MPLMWCALIAMVLTAAPIETIPAVERSAPIIPFHRTVVEDPAFTAAAPRFPKPEKIVFEPLNETQLVYAKPFRIVQDVTPTRRGPLTIKGTLRYQACDDKVCYRPTNVPLEWMVR